MFKRPFYIFIIAICVALGALVSLDMKKLHVNSEDYTQSQHLRFLAAFT